MAKRKQEPPKTQYTFSLAEEHDPILRLGILGLYRVLELGKDHEGYPSHVTYSVTDDKILTVNVQGLEDFTALLTSAYKDDKYGLLCFPGCELNVISTSIYPTVMQHKAITRAFMPSKRVTERLSYSANDPKCKKVLADLGYDFLPKEQGLSVKVSYTHHTKIPLSQGSLKKDAKPFTLEKVSPGTLHPTFTKWNDKTLVLTEHQKVLLGFARFAYIGASLGVGKVDMVVVGMAFSTFSKFLRAMKSYLRKGGNNDLYCIKIPAAPITAALVLIQTYKMDGGTFHIMAIDTKDLVLDRIYIPSEAEYDFADFLAKQLEEVGDPREQLKALPRIPVVIRDKVTKVTAYDIMLENVIFKRPWYQNLGQIGAIDNLSHKTIDKLQTIIVNMEKTNKMDEKIRTTFWRLIDTLSRHEQELGLDKNKAYERVRERIELSFRNARTKQQVLNALVNFLGRTVNEFSLSQEESDLLYNFVQTNHQAAQDLFRLLNVTRRATKAISTPVTTTTANP